MNIIQAAAISVGVCDSCPAVHVNLLDAHGEVFATASVPAHVGREFIRRFEAELEKTATRSPAPAARQ